MRPTLVLCTVAACCLMFEARAQNSPSITGCDRAAQTFNVAVDADQSSKLNYKDASGNNAATLHVCPGDRVMWTSAQTNDQLAISFAKQGGKDTPADDGKMTTRKKHQIAKHIKKNHARLQYPYSVTLTRNGTDTTDDPLIIIGQ